MNNPLRERDIDVLFFVAGVQHFNEFVRQEPLIGEIMGSQNDVEVYRGVAER